MSRKMKLFLKILFFVILIAIAVFLIYYGVYYTRISREDYIFHKMIDQVFDKTDKVLSIDPDYMVGDKFTVEGNLKMNLSSEEYQNKSKTDLEYKKKNNKLINLSKMDVDYSFKHNKDKGLVFYSLDSKIGEEEIFSGKYYIENSTEYFFINNVVKQYVNDGGNNYFESFKKDTTTADNIDYLYYFIRDSLKKNIGKEELNGYDVETFVGDNTIKAGQISYKITNKSYKTLLKGLLKDLKNDKRASQILSLMYPDYEDWKVSEKKKYLKKNESYTISIYVSKPFFKPVKYEVVYLKDDYKKTYSYEGNLSEGLFYYSENNEIEYRAKCSFDNKKINILVYDKFRNEIGSIKVEKDKKNFMFTMTLELENDKYDITYYSKNTDIKKNSYTRTDNLTFKIMDDMVIKIQGEITAESKISSTAKIMEDVSESILRSTLTDEESNKLKENRDKIKLRLEK